MAVVLVVGLVLLSAALLVPGLLIGPSLDAAVFNHVAGRMLDGVPLYLGAWDHKPPGIYLATAAARAILGWLGPWTAEWLLSVAATAGIGLAVAATLTRLGVTGRPRALAAGGAVALAGQYLLALGGGLSEPLAAALVAVALVGVLRPAGRWQMAAIGILLGGALLVSPQVLPGVLVIAALGLLGAPVPSRVLSLSLMAIGAAVPIAGVAAWLAISGALSAAFDAVIGYTAAYRAASGDYGVTLGAPVASWTLLASLFLIAPAILGATSMPRAVGLRRRVGVASLVWIAGSGLLVLLQGRFYAHYAIPLAVPLGILAGCGLARMQELLPRVRSWRRAAVILAPAVVALAISVVAGSVATAMQIAPLARESRQMAAVSAWIRSLPAGSGSMLVWGNQPHLYELAGREPTIRFSYLYSLTTPGYSSPALIAEVGSDLAAHPPSVIVDAGSDVPGAPGFLPLLIPRPVAREGRDLDLLDPLRTFIAAHYQLATTVDGWPIYLMKDAPAL